MIALRRSRVQIQRDVLVGTSPAIQLNVNATRMRLAFVGSYIQQMVPGEVNEFVQCTHGGHRMFRIRTLACSFLVLVQLPMRPADALFEW